MLTLCLPLRKWGWLAPEAPTPLVVGVLTSLGHPNTCSTRRSHKLQGNGREAVPVGRGRRRITNQWHFPPLKARVSTLRGGLVPGEWSSRCLVWGRRRGDCFRRRAGHIKEPSIAGADWKTAPGANEEGVAMVAGGGQCSEKTAPPNCGVSVPVPLSPSSQATRIRMGLTQHKPGTLLPKERPGYSQVQPCRSGGRPPVR